MVVLALMLAAQPVGNALDGLPSVSQDRIEAAQDYEGCLSSESLALERSGAAFDDIFAAADTACSHAWGKLQDLTTRDFAKRIGLNEEPSDVAYRLTNTIKDGAKPKIRLKFLRLRTLRNTK